VLQALQAVPDSCRVLINDRLDVACAAGASGVHLGEKSIAVRAAKRFVSDRGLKDFLIGASVHSLDAARAAEKDGAEYVIFGPVFATPSKAIHGPPQGLEQLGAVCKGISIPALAIGGITAENACECFARGASGIAAIRVFQEADNLDELVNDLRA
jgi:thiamine-phosphate pyrophosphorylase